MPYRHMHMGYDCMALIWLLQRPYFTSSLFEIVYKQGVLGIKEHLQLCTFLMTLTLTKASFLYSEITL